MTSCSSMPTMRPKPSHSGQAPTGELKAKRLSEGSLNVMPSASKRVEKVFSSPLLSQWSIISPPPS